MKEKNANTVQQEQHLRDYWRVAWNGRWTVLSIFTVVVVFCGSRCPHWPQHARAGALSQGDEFARSLGHLEFRWKIGVVRV